METLLKFQQSSGITPKALANRPVLAEHLVYYWQLFSELAEERVYSGMGEPRGLSLQNFLAYAALYQFTRLEVQQSWEYVRLIDGLWMDEHRKWRVKESNKTSKPTTKPT